MIDSLWIRMASDSSRGRNRVGTTSAWRKLDPGRSAQLARGRIEVHWAVQLAAAPGACLLPAQDDFGHTNLGWSRALDAFVGRAVYDDGTAAALRPRDLTLLVV